MKKYSGLFFTKEGMTSIWNEQGIRIPITVLKVLNSVRIDENHIFVDGIKRLKKPQTKMLDDKNISHGKRGFIKKNDSEQSLDFFENISFVDTTALSKGKGFAGVMKRHHFSGGRASHGESLGHRSAGSTGQCQDPGKTPKGRKMAGRMGHDKVTQLNLKLIQVRKDDGVILVKGSVPGPKRSLVLVRKAIKKK